MTELRMKFFLLSSAIFSPISKRKESSSIEIILNSKVYPFNNSRKIAFKYFSKFDDYLFIIDKFITGGYRAKTLLRITERISDLETQIGFYGPIISSVLQWIQSCTKDFLPLNFCVV